MLRPHSPRKRRETKKKVGLKDKQVENQPNDKYLKIHFIISPISLKTEWGLPKWISNMNKNMVTCMLLRNQNRAKETKHDFRFH